MSSQVDDAFMRELGELRGDATESPAAFWSYFTDDERTDVSEYTMPRTEEGDKWEAQIKSLPPLALLRLAKVLIGELHAQDLSDMQPDACKSLHNSERWRASQCLISVEEALGHALLDAWAGLVDVKAVAGQVGSALVQAHYAKLLAASRMETALWGREAYDELWRRGAMSRDRYEEIMALKDGTWQEWDAKRMEKQKAS